MYMHLTALALLASPVIGFDLTSAVLPRDFDWKKILAVDTILEGRKLQEVPDVSAFCLISYLNLEDGQELLASLFPEPQAVLDNNFALLGLDFAANVTSFTAYDGYCNSLGGHTLTVDINYSGDTCQVSGLLSLLNFPMCIGGSCNEDDADTLLTQSIVQGMGEMPAGCDVSVSAEIDGDGEGIPLPEGIPEICINDMATIFVLSGLYEDYLGAIVSEETGEYTGDTAYFEMFEYNCTDSDRGRIVTINSDVGEACDEPDFVQVPACVAAACTNDEATVGFDFLTSIFLEPQCRDRAVLITDNGFNPSSTKKKKKGKKTKASKKGKKTKVPKASKKGKKKGRREI